MRIRIELAAPFGHDVPPSRCLNRHADSQEGQNGFDQNGFSTNIGALHDERRSGVGEDVTQENLPHRRIQGNGRFNVGFLSHRQHNGAHQSGNARNTRNSDGGHHDDQSVAEHSNQTDCEEDGRDRHKAIHHAHHHGIHPAEIARKQPGNRTEENREERH